MGFKDEVAGDGKGGGFDQGSNMDFREIPTGKQTFANVPFNIINPDNNNNKSMIVLKGRQIKHFPEEVKGIKVGEKLKKIYFLHTSAWSSGGKFVYIINYDDGTKTEISINVGKEIAEWTNPNEDIAPESKIGWQGKNLTYEHIGAYCYRWINPETNKKISSIDIRTHSGDKMEFIPAILGITGEK
jgi:beta-galactosidase